MGKINYSEEFKKKIKRVYRDNPKILDLLENNEEILGRYLDDNSHYSGDQIMQLVENAFENAFDIGLLQMEIEEIREKEKCYSEWKKEYGQSLWGR